MSTATHQPPHPSDTLDLWVRAQDLTETIRWAPAPRWGATAGSHVRYVSYLAGSILGWIVIGLGIAATLSAVLGVSA